MLRADELTRHFALLASSLEGDAGLNAVMDEANKAAATEDPELVRHALLLFITHDPKGNSLKIKPLEKRAPEEVLPSRVPLQRTATIAAAPSEAELNWFREDPKANEHHEHWHLVYPWTGDPTTGQARERQGELFLYMHEQMIARYNTERLAVGLDPVKPLLLSDDRDYTEQVPEAYDPDPHLEVDAPHGLTYPFSSRAAGKQFGALPGGLTVAVLKRWGDNLLQAAQSGTFQDGRAVTANLLGATVEATIDSVDPDVNAYVQAARSNSVDDTIYQHLLASAYGSHHNKGHGFLANINAPQNPYTVPGVMSETRTAIRDPIFFRWHKHIDDISFLWQEQQAPNNYSDAPQVQIRKGLSGASPQNASPDIILCFKNVIFSPGSDDSDAFWQAYGETHFGDANWNTDFASSATTTGELQTAMRQRTITFTEDDNRTETISFLYPREFFYFLRVENLLPQAQDVTVRIFLVPTGPYAGANEVAEDRRMWIEMDKFRYTLQPSQREVIFRRAESSSVIRRPALKTFPPVKIPDTSPDDDRGDVSCDCGWPYNLLLPRGTRAGMRFRFLVMLTDWEKDRLPDAPACGSMSYCGAKEKYPDSRGMGYPFDKPFPAGQSIAQTIAAQSNMATRDITIKWVDSVP
jgi:tyrosinase